MGFPIKQSQTAQPLVFLLVLSSDHITGATGLSPTVTLSKNGGSFGSPAGAVTEIGNGWYKVAGNATDTATLGPLLLHASVATADPTDDCFQVVGWDPQQTAFDQVTIESGINARQALAAILATECGKASGMATNAPVFTGGGNSTTRVSATTDANGNRSAVTLSLPT